MIDSSSTRCRKPFRPGIRTITYRKFRKAARGYTRKSLRDAINAFWRHPVTLLVLGFFLTAVVGGAIQQRQQLLERKRAEAEAVTSALDKMYESSAKYLLRLEFVVKAHDRNEVQRRKVDADEAFVNAQSTWISQWAIIRRGFPSSQHEKQRRMELGFQVLRGDLEILHDQISRRDHILEKDMYLDDPDAREIISISICTHDYVDQLQAAVDNVSSRDERVNWLDDQQYRISRCDFPLPR
ncbi:hypothetical protein [Paraburkholderia hospita]|uniref:hypothetical protein n=1 Tax=Paraburkholderia hospita TaxID=169430 RepID=UPI0002717259|nr:hypothetical protein [Paraburkholderia hospita]EUC12652.1 hypothetical protein PMI06_008407 [Burkholderia sp. BT03]SKC46814.1 hypothetical protein SAMN06266956_0129 [Paraburkholderia hospita]